MFQIVERAVPPDIGRLLGGVSLLFTPFGLRGPPATLKEDEFSEYSFIAVCS